MLIAASFEICKVSRRRTQSSKLRRKTRVLCVVAAGRTACAAACPTVRSNPCPAAQTHPQNQKAMTQLQNFLQFRLAKRGWLCFNLSIEDRSYKDHEQRAYALAASVARPGPHRFSQMLRPCWVITQSGRLFWPSNRVEPRVASSRVPVMAPGIFLYS